MGSLTPGWYSVVNKDPKIASYERNKSLTKDDIAAYWKSKKNKEEADNNKEEGIEEGAAAAQVLQRSTSLPATDQRKESTPKMERPELRNCWWTRSNWAFLNEPPITAMEGPKYKYAAQYHIADFCNPKITTAQ